MNVEEIRKDFPILSRKVGKNNLVYFDNAATSQKPKQVVEAVVDYYEYHNANVHRGIHALSEEATELVVGARRKMAAFIGASSEREVIFTKNASEAVNLVMYTWGVQNIKEKDVVVISLQEHHSNLVTWQRLCEAKGAVLKVIDVDDQGRLWLKGVSKKSIEGVEVGTLESILSEKVKLVAVTAVSNVLGTKNSLSQIRQMMKTMSPRAKLFVDGSQSVPHQEVDVSKSGFDFMVFSGHKMLGPTGIGVLWAKESTLEQMPPFMYGGDMISEVKLNTARWNELPWKFEAGTPNMAGMVGMGAAVEYLEKIGMEKIDEYEMELTEYALEKMRELEEKGVLELYGPRDAKERAGVISFNVKGVHAHDAAQILDSFGIAIRSGQHCGAPVVEKFGVTAMARASFYFYNTKKEIDYFVSKIPEVREVFKLV